jgi:hypothetical protein
MDAAGQLGPACCLNVRPCPRENKLDLEALRAKLRRISDDALNRFGQAARVDVFAVG